MKNLRIFAALFLAFGSLFFVSPAKAQTIQFTYYWTSHDFTFTDAQVTVVVTNNITNTIGGGVTADSYKISVNNTLVVDSSEIHDARTYVFNLYGTQTLTLEGIDNGYWGGYYGPIMEVTSAPLQPEGESSPTESPSVASESPTPTESASVSSESSVAPTTSPETEATSSPEPASESPITQSPETQSPASESSSSQPLNTPSQSPVTWDYTINEGGVLEAVAPTNMVFSGVIAQYVAFDTECGADVSEIVGAVFIGTNMASINADNGVFGDPCPGWYKKLQVAFTYANDPAAVPTQSPTVSPEPTPEPTPTPTPTPQPEPEPTSTPIPEPTPTPTPSPEPTPEPTPLPPVEPSPEPSPTPEPEPTPVEPEPTPSPEPEPSPTPTPTPTPITPTEPEPSKPAQPSPTPSPSPVEPKPVPTPTPEPTPNPEPSVPPVAEVLQNIANVEPTTLTETQVAELKEAALATFETAQPGSEEYEAALDALLIAAQADDIVLDEELAAIPLIGNVAGAAVEVFNALGNAGADMSPQVREQSEKVVIAAVIVGQVAMTATAAATSAAAAAARRP